MIKRIGPTAFSTQEGLSDSRESLGNWVTFVAEEIRNFLNEFRGIEIAVGPGDAGEPILALVHPPYMIQTVAVVDNEKEFAKLKKRHQERLKKVKKARENAPDDVKVFLRSQFRGDGGRERAIAKGRAEAEDIRRLLQEAVDQRLVPVLEGRDYPDGRDLRRWLREYGIGVDCSAFVQQAHTRLVEASRVAVGDARNTGHDYRVGWMTSSGVYRDVTADAESRDRFDQVPTPDKARPGDVLVKRGHIRIVAGVGTAEDGGVILSLAESTSARDILSGQASEEDDIGPRLLQVKYPEPDNPISEQTPLWKRLSEKEFRAERTESVYVLGRLGALDQLCREHQAPDAKAAPPTDLSEDKRIGRKYRPSDWIDPRIEIRPSPIEGRGMFASAPIKQGEVVTVWGGTLLLTEEDIAGERAREWQDRGYVWATIGEGLYLASLPGEGKEDLTNLINHSCDPNVWMHGEVTLVARRDINVGEELTIDYAMFEGDEEWAAPWECRCGSELCRGGHTGRAWRRRELQERYRSRFSPFINERIQRLQASGSECEHGG